MAYRIRFYESARTELDEACETYGDGLRTDLWNWLREIVQAAETGSEIGSVDIIELLDEGLDQDGNQWNHVLQQWWRAAPIDKLKAGLVVLQKRCPPWQLQFTVNWFDVLGRFSCEVRVHYLVDHVNKRVIFTLFDGLPGQP